MIDTRDGLHAGDEQYARVNNIPRPASRSKFGVRIGAFLVHRSRRFLDLIKLAKVADGKKLSPYTRTMSTTPDTRERINCIALAPHN